jgi:hypothetical protein
VLATKPPLQLSESSGVVNDGMCRPLSILSAALLSACATPYVPPPPDATPAPPQAANPAPSEDPLTLYPSSGGMGHQARLIGRLVLEGGCLYVVNPRGQRWIPVFRSPHTRWNAALAAVETNYGETWRVGEIVALGGGGSDASSWSKPPPPGCAGDRFWLVTDPFMSERRPWVSPLPPSAEERH